MKRTLKIFRVRAYDYEGKPWEPSSHTQIPDIVLDWWHQHKEELGIDTKQLSVEHSFDHLNFDRLIALRADITDEEWFMIKLKLVDT